MEKHERATQLYNKMKTVYTNFIADRDKYYRDLVNITDSLYEFLSIDDVVATFVKKEEPKKTAEKPVSYKKDA